MSLGAPASQATPTPAGKPLDGSASPAFEPVTEHAAGSPGGSAPSAPGAAPSAMPSWMASFMPGGSPAASTGPSAQSLRQAYVPGTSLSGYGMPRERTVWQAPTKTAAPAAASGIPDLPTGGYMAGFEPDYNGPASTLTADQKKMMEWVKWVNGADAASKMYGHPSGWTPN